MLLIGFLSLLDKADDVPDWYSLLADVDGAENSLSYCTKDLIMPPPIVAIGKSCSGCVLRCQFSHRGGSMVVLRAVSGAGLRELDVVWLHFPKVVPLDLVLHRLLPFGP